MKHFFTTLLTLTLSTTASASPVLADTVEIHVDATDSSSAIRPLWAWVGYDEPNYTYMKDGKKLLTELSAMNYYPVNVRVHNLLSTGDGEAALKWGSTNAYTEDSEGNPVYDWTITDSIFDTFVERGMRPLVQIGFMPEALSTNPSPYRHNWTPRDPYDKIFTGWAYPPNDYDKWRELIYQWASHCRDRYGIEEVKDWYWEVWNEPNLYLKGSLEDYCKMYDYAVDGLLRALPDAIVGGPHSTGPRDPRAADYLRKFIDHCLNGTNYATGRQGTPLRYIGYHAKGAPKFSDDGKVLMSIRGQLLDVEEGFKIVNEFPELKGIPVIIGEFDPEGCAACSSEFVPQFDYRNGTMYSSTLAATYGRMQDLAEKYDVNLAGAVTWAFEFEGQPWFAGFRDLSTNGVGKPVLNVMRMLGQMKGNKLKAESSGMVQLDSITKKGVRHQNDVGVLASNDNGEISILVWNYHDLDEPYAEPSPISLNIKNIKGKRVKSEHFRVDLDHSNAFNEWRKMGRPATPSENEREILNHHGQLRQLTSAKWLEVKDGNINFEFDLPRQGVSLIKIYDKGEDYTADSPIGTGKGIYPGRVTWTRDTEATLWDGKNGKWWDEGMIDQKRLDTMFSESLCALTESATSGESWEKIFHYFNLNHNKGDKGYSKGETIAVKINLNNTYDADDADNDIDQSPQATRTLLRQLIDSAGIAPGNIILYDATIGWRTRAIPRRLYEPIHREFPEVRWMSAEGGEGIEPAEWVENAITYTNPEVKLGNALPKAVVEADYIINESLLKGHEMTGVTLGAKNHFGSIQFPAREHGSAFVHQMKGKRGDYSALVDLMGADNLGNKTLLYIVDGLYGMQTNVGAPRKGRDTWNTLPGKEHWSSCYFMSLDPVAIEAVCLDFLASEFGGELGFSGAPQFPKGAVNNCDNYLREAASGHNAEFGDYRPNGVASGSLGVFEHWNNPFDRLYSRNRGLSLGIELIDASKRAK